MLDRFRTSDLAACRAYLRGRGELLYDATRLLPPRLHEPLVGLYAFTGSVADMVRGQDATRTAATDAATRVRGAFSGQASRSPIDRVFAKVAAEHALEPRLFEAFVEGLRWDFEGRRYATLEGLVDYNVRVAAAPALAACAIAGRKRASVLERVADLAIAIALTRVAASVGADAKEGRVYLPIEWLEEAGADVDLHDAQRRDPAVHTVVKRVLQSADAFYTRSDPGLSALPFDCRPAVRSARYLHGALKDTIMKGEDAAALPLLRRVRLVTRALRASRSESRELVRSAGHPASELVDMLAGEASSD